MIRRKSLGNGDGYVEEGEGESHDFLERSSAPGQRRVLGQRAAGDKFNEITAIPQLLALILRAIFVNLAPYGTLTREQAANISKCFN